MKTPTNIAILNFKYFELLAALLLILGLTPIQSNAATLEELQQQASNLRDSINEKNGELTAKYSELATAQSAASGNTANYDFLSSQLSAFDAEHAEEIAQKNARLAEISQQRSQLIASIGYLDPNDEDTPNQIEAINGSINTLDLEESQIQAELEALAAERSTLEEQACEVYLAISDAENEIAAIQASIASLEAEIQSLQSQLGDVENAINNYQPD